MKIILTDKLLCALNRAGISTSLIMLYKHIANNTSIGVKATFDHQTFKTWMLRNDAGKAYSPRHMNRLFYKLEEVGLAKVNFLGLGRFEVTLFSLDFALGLKSRLETGSSKEEKSEKKDPEKDTAHSSPSTRIKQQQLIEIKRKCTEAGLNFRLEKDWYKLLNHGIEKVSKTIQVFKFRKLTTEITNPCGWFISAIERNYWLDFSFEDVGNQIKKLIKKKEEIEGSIRQYAYSCPS